MAERKTKTWRVLGIYALLVVAPVLLSIVLLTGDNGSNTGAPPAEAVTGHPLARLLLAIAVVVAACKAAGCCCGGSVNRR